MEITRVGGWKASILGAIMLPEDALAWAFSLSFWVGSLAGCLHAAARCCLHPVTLPTTSTPAHFVHTCDILLTPWGPSTQAMIFLPQTQGCTVDICLGTGPCLMLSVYCETSLLLGGQVFPWQELGLCSKGPRPQPSHFIFPHQQGLAPFLTLAGQLQLLVAHFRMPAPPCTM